MWKHGCTVLLASTSLLVAAAARAQAPAPAPAPKPTTDAATLGTPSVPTPAPATAPAAATPALSAPAAPSAAPATAPEVKWYDKVKLDAFVDAYYAVNYNFPRPQSGLNMFHAFDQTDGFAINWAGLNLSYGPDPVGATINLRFGPGANVANALEPTGLQNVKQALVSWKPGGARGSFTFDLGKFDSPYGAEVADSQGNMNYSRSLLFTLAQPLFFTGLRADYAISDVWDIKLFLANGWNNSVSMNQGKTGGAQINFKPNDKLIVAAGYALGPQQPDSAAPSAFPVAACPTVAGGLAPCTASAAGTTASDGRFRHLVDLVVDYSPTDKLRFLLNGDVGAEDLGPLGMVSWEGWNLGVRYAAGAGVAASIRGGMLNDPQGYAASLFTAPTTRKTTLVDGTVTLEYAPVLNLVMKLEQRFDYVDAAGAGMFTVNAGGGPSHTQSMTLFGVVASTN